MDIELSKFFWDKEGHNISIAQLEEYLNDRTYVITGRDTIDNCWIATDWMPCHLGIPKFLFETYIAVSRLDQVDGYIWGRYLTEEAAKIGHAEAVAHCQQHQQRCCREHDTHAKPHVDCIFR